MILPVVLGKFGPEAWFLRCNYLHGGDESARVLGMTHRHESQRKHAVILQVVLCKLGPEA